MSKESIVAEVLVQERETGWVRLAVPLPCCRLLPSGTTCMQETDIAFAVFHSTHITLFPYCGRHQPVLKQTVVGRED